MKCLQDSDVYGLKLNDEIISWVVIFYINIVISEADNIKVICLFLRENEKKNNFKKENKLNGFKNNPRGDFMKIIERDYLNKLIGVIGTPDIKIITGVRRSGKSKLLSQFKEYIEKYIENYIYIKCTNIKNKRNRKKISR